MVRAGNHLHRSVADVDGELFRLLSQKSMGSIRAACHTAAVRFVV